MEARRGEVARPHLMSRARGKGWLRHGRCKHVSALRVLIERGSI